MARSQLTAPLFATPSRPGGLPLAANVRAAIRAVQTILQTWEIRHKSRRSLRNLDHRLMLDIGLSAREIETEIGKRFWQA